MRKIAIAFVFLSTIAAAQTAPPEYQIWALKYATIKNFPVSSLVKGADESRKSDIAMMIWLVRAGDRNIIVDSGFYRPSYFKSWDVSDFVRPDEMVKRAGVNPEDVTDVILTHAHWDHADGADLFPKAKIWMQKDEYRYYTLDAWQPGGKHGGIDREDVQFWVRANLDGRMKLVDGDQEIYPGLRVYIGGRHTFASQYVSANTRDGAVILASDNVYLYENLDKHVPIAQTFDEKSNLAAQDKMRTLVKDPQLIIPGHDPLVMKRFPFAGEGMVRIR